MGLILDRKSVKVDSEKSKQANLNLVIYRDAVQSVDPALCNNIYGVGYGFGPTDEVIYLEEEVVKADCREDSIRGDVSNGELKLMMNNLPQ